VANVYRVKPCGDFHLLQDTDGQNVAVVLAGGNTAVLMAQVEQIALERSRLQDVAVQAYHALNRTGWEPGPNDAEVASRIHDELANQGIDPDGDTDP
jgi:hypothetical protein